MEPPWACTCLSEFSLSVSRVFSSKAFSFIRSVLSDSAVRRDCLSAVTSFPNCSSYTDTKMGTLNSFLCTFHIIWFHLCISHHTRVFCCRASVSILHNCLKYCGQSIILCFSIRIVLFITFVVSKPTNGCYCNSIISVHQQQHSHFNAFNVLTFRHSNKGLHLFVRQGLCPLFTCQLPYLRMKVFGRLINTFVSSPLRAHREAYGSENS